MTKPDYWLRMLLAHDVHELGSSKEMTPGFGSHCVWFEVCVLSNEEDPWFIGLCLVQGWFKGLSLGQTNKRFVSFVKRDYF